MHNSPVRSQPLAFLAGGGELGELMRQKDWSQTGLGPSAEWPQSLKTAVRIMLTSRQPIWIGWGPELTYVYNDPYKAIIGGKHPEALGQPTRVVWREIWDVISPMLSTALSGDEGTYVESQLLIMERHGYREETYYTFSYSPIPDDNGVAGGIICANTDDTRRVVGERQLALLRQLSAGTANVRSLHDACTGARNALITNPYDIPFALIFLAEPGDSKLVLAEACGVDRSHPIANEAAWSLDRALAGKTILITENLKELFGQNLPMGAWAEATDRAALVPLAAQGETSRGGVLVIGLNPFRLFDENYQNFLGLIGGQIAASIAGAQSYEAERQRAQALAELDRAKTEFFSNVSHEFRTPLTLMLGPIEEMLRKGGPDLTPTAKHQLELVHRNSLRLMKLVNTMLDFSTIEAGRTEPNFSEVDLGAYTAELASVFRAAVEGAGLKLAVECAQMPGLVLIDREMWEKVVLNLLSNAFKFTLTGEIEVKLETIGSDVRLTVRDTGIGIPQEELPRIFERFHRVKESRGRTHEGTGIGLALVQELVRLQGGSIRVESEIDKGSRFIVSMPLERPRAPAGRGEGHREHRRNTMSRESFVKEAMRWTTSSTPSIAQDLIMEANGPSGLDQEEKHWPSGDRPRILWADDNADMRDYVRRLLEERFEVTAVADGQAALDSIKFSPPDLVLSDVMMPKLDGFGLMKELRADAVLRTIPIILLSARAGEESRIDGITAGADDYLVKPFGARELLARVESHVKMARFRRESHSQFETLLNQAPIGVYVVDADLRIRHVNPTARPVFGDIPGLVGRDLEEVTRILWPTAQAAEIIQRFRHTLETGESFSEPELAEERADRGKTEYYEWRIDRIPLPEGRHGVVAYFRDISDQVRARLALQAARDEALAANQAKDEFLATLSHELRTPLNPALLVASDSADNEALPENVRGEFRMIANNISLQARLIDDLLDFSRIVHGKVKMERRPLDLHATVRDAAATIHEEIRAKNIELTFSFASSSPVVDGDPVRLRQVFWNVLKNAHKFTPKGGRIEISSSEGPDGEIQIHVRDTGIGMGPQELSRIFFPFVQGRHIDENRQERYGGLGLGLAISRMLVESHGGTITAESSGPHKGSTFTIRLPQRPKGKAESATAPQEGAFDTNGRKHSSVRILFVEDHESTREALGRILRRRGYHVRSAASVQEALRAAEGEDFDVLVSDLGLPDGSGSELMSQLRSKWPSLLGIAISGFGMNTDITRSHAAGFGEHLTKPVSIDSLDRALARILKG